MKLNWKADYHEPERIKYEEALAAGKTDAKPPVRLGRICPFATPYKLPDSNLLSPGVVAETIELTGAVADCLDERPSPKFDKNRPYRPWRVLQFIDEIMAA